MYCARHFLNSSHILSVVAIVVFLVLNLACFKKYGKNGRFWKSMFVVISIALVSVTLNCKKKKEKKKDLKWKMT